MNRARNATASKISGLVQTARYRRDPIAVAYLERSSIDALPSKGCRRDIADGSIGKCMGFASFSWKWVASFEIYWSWDRVTQQSPWASMEKRTCMPRIVLRVPLLVRGKI